MSTTLFRHRLMSVEDFRERVRYHGRYSLGKEWEELTSEELHRCVALAFREAVTDALLASEKRARESGAKRLSYLSLEFLLGRSLANNLRNLGVHDLVREALQQEGIDLEEVAASERDPALGNGGLGRLAACFLDSLATLGYPATGYGINYEFGLFRQTISDGYQKESPDPWRTLGNPWLWERREEACLVPLYGEVVKRNRDGHAGSPVWTGWKAVIGVPADMPIVGYGGHTVNVLRLFSARSSDDFDMEIFNGGDYLKAVEQKITSETISKVLYPSDSVEAGRELRLIQEYFLVACSVRDVVRRHLRQFPDLTSLPEHATMQLNDTHPALAVSELMRTLVDEHHLGWDRAWGITSSVLAFTNHTLMPEALEEWPVPLLERVLPRHMDIIYRINHRFLRQVSRRWPGDIERMRRMSIISEGRPKRVRMAHLAIVGSHSVNGVARLHTQLLTSTVVPDFFKMWPERFNNKTNGVTPRRWLLNANPELALLLNRILGDGWITDLQRLRALEPHSDNPDFRAAFAAIKRHNKERLARLIRDKTLIAVDPGSLFDVQAKRMHEYKRQLLNVLHVIHVYLSVVEDGETPSHPRTWLFAGKAAPGYWAAKQIIKLIHSLAGVVNDDPRARDCMRVVFLPDYRVSLAEALIPAADLSEQISTAGTEASGTGNMKFALNGALTIGTLDGANIEIRDEVGAENMFIFGHTADEIAALRASGSYRPRERYETDPRLRRVVDALASDRFCPGEPGLFRWIVDALLDGGDPYFHLADLPSYIDSHRQVLDTYLRPDEWTRKAIFNVARMGRFSSDRTVREYARDIWKIRPLE